MSRPHALLWSLMLAISLIASLYPCHAQVSSQLHKSAAKSGSHRTDTKCTFLREEYLRTKKVGESYVEGSPVANVSQLAQLLELEKTPDDLAEYVAENEANAARLTILSADIRSCDQGQLLSNVERLPLIEAVRGKHVSRIEARWIHLGGTKDDDMCHKIVNRINEIYDDEAKSFYNSDVARVSLDPDIIKDYPDLLSLLQASSLPAEQKDFFQENAKYLKYEEAGNLFNILKGMDKSGSLGYVYTLRKTLTERVQQASLEAKAASAKSAQRTAAIIGDVMNWVWIIVSIALVVAASLVVFRQSKRYAKYRAISTGHLRTPYWWGLRELVLWEPGEAVVLLRNKKLVAMSDATGGYTSISAWSGEEYKGRITYKSQMMRYTSDPIHTSDGVSVNLDLGIWWHIQNPNMYISRIAADYHVNGTHHGTPKGYTETPKGEKYFDEKLKETAEEWIRVLAGSSLREHICQLTAAKLISPYIESYIHRYFDPGDGETQQHENRMPTVLGETADAINSKTNDYGIRLERLEVQELKLPSNLRAKLESVRLSFLEPARATAETEAKTIEKKGLNQTQLEALRGLADIIGKDNVAKIEFLKAVGIAKIPFVAPYAPPLSALQAVFTNPQSVLGSEPPHNTPPLSSHEKMASEGTVQESPSEPNTEEGTDAA